MTDYGEPITRGERKLLRRMMSERTPEEYAIEHGRYLVTAAKHFMTVVDRETGLPGDARTDAWRALNKAIYEFEKRADRAYPKPNN